MKTNSINLGLQDEHRLWHHLLYIPRGLDPVSHRRVLDEVACMGPEHIYSRSNIYHNLSLFFDLRKVIE